MEIQRFRQRHRKQTDKNAGRKIDRRTGRQTDLKVLFCSAAFQAGRHQEGRRQAVGVGGQKRCEEGRKDGSQAGKQECRRAEIPADSRMYRCANIDKVNNLHNTILSQTGHNSGTLWGKN
jgi:hypothetical protein